jgi:acyl carrier protein
MENKIKMIMEQIFNQEIDDDFSKNNTDKWDSFAHLDLIVRLEQELNISFSPEEIGAIESYDDLKRIIDNK